MFGHKRGAFTGAIDNQQGLFEAGFEAGLVTDGAIAHNNAQRDAFWHIRETIPEANRRIGSVSSHDISIPLSAIPSFIERGAQALAQVGDFRINCFGHLGDGNLHYNIFPAQGRGKAEYVTRRDEIKRAVHDISHDLGGSHSAEHGIGTEKRSSMSKFVDPTKLSLMHAIKATIDPMNIMNPGKVLPPK